MLVRFLIASLIFLLVADNPYQVLQSSSLPVQTPVKKSSTNTSYPPLWGEVIDSPKKAKFTYESLVEEQPNNDYIPKHKIMNNAERPLSVKWRRAGIIAEGANGQIQPGEYIDR